MTSISRSGMGLSIARPIGKIKQRPLKLKSVGVAPGMRQGGPVKTKGWGVSRATNKCKTV